MGDINTEMIQAFLDDRMMIVVVILYIIGAMLKKSSVNDWMIPWIIMAVSISFAFVIVGFTAMAVIQGVLAAGMTVYFNQLVRQTTDKRK